MDIYTLITESRITNATIAEAINMKRATFNNKIKGNNGTYFTIEEAEKIKVFLKSRAKTIIEFD